MLFLRQVIHLLHIVDGLGLEASSHSLLGRNRQDGERTASLGNVSQPCVQVPDMALRIPPVCVCLLQELVPLVHQRLCLFEGLHTLR